MVASVTHGDAIERRFVEHEHREMAHGLNRISEVAELAGSLAAPDLTRALRGLLNWLESTLEPHADWEETWLYPKMDAAARSGWATRMMRFEHRQIRRMIAALEIDLDALRHEPTHAQLVGLRAHLYGLSALVAAHLEREEQLLLPLLGEETSAEH
jgi:hemerythrin-like domain-containing protein